MSLLLRRKIAVNAISPYGLAALAYILFFCACILPPSIYSYYMHEPDLMYLDPATILFYTGCVVSFIAGVRLMHWLFPFCVQNHQFNTKVPPVLFLLAPLAVAVIGAAISMFRLLHMHPEIIVLLLSNQSSEVKDMIAFDSEGDFVKTTLLLVVVIWWVYWRSSDMTLGRWKRAFVRAALSVSVLVVIAVSTFTLLRNFMMMVLFGLVVLYLVRKVTHKEMDLRLLLRASILIGIGVVTLFFATSAVRGFTGINELVTQLLGYTFASYNRLAAILDGRLHYPFAGRGVYLSYIAAYNTAVNRVIPIGRLINAPDFLNLWGSEFTAVSQAGLNGGLIWAGTFGYIYSDLGWFSFAWVFGYGIAYGLIWKSLLKGNIFGIFLYPFFAYSEVGWWGTNGLLDSPLIIFLGAAVLFRLYEATFLRRNSPTVVSTIRVA